MGIEKQQFSIPGVSPEEMEKVREQGEKEYKEINKASENGTGVKGRTLHDALELGKEDKSKIEDVKKEILESFNK